jgi:hypothetical protein
VALANLAIVLRPFGCITPDVLHYLTFQSSDFETYLMMVIPETRRAHLISMFLLLLDTFMLANTKHLFGFPIFFSSGVHVCVYVFITNKIA